MRRTAQGFTLIEIMVVIAIIAGLVTAVSVMVPKMQENQKRTSCMSNQAGLAQLYLVEANQNRGKAQKYSGVAMWLSYRAGSTPLIKSGNEKALICNGDNVAIPETDADRKAYDNVNLDNPPDNLCSYAARDFKNAPMNVESKEKEIVGSDRQGANGKSMHHVDCIICAYEDGDAQIVTRNELGVTSEEPITIGPEATNSSLKKVVYIVRKD
jgi:prepilin-type N-terminal cleavage/methylation domain-containing protein